jgi:hypothetical protein
VHRIRQFAALIAVVVLTDTGCQRHKVVTRMMRWTESLPADFPGDGAPPRAGLVYIFHLDHECFYAMHEKGLRDRLRANGRNPVPVEFTLMSDGWGSSVAGARVDKIDGVAARYGPESAWDTYGCRGGEPEPFAGEF